MSAIKNRDKVQRKIKSVPLTNGGHPLLAHHIKTILICHVALAGSMSSRESTASAMMRT